MNSRYSIDIEIGKCYLDISALAIGQNVTFRRTLDRKNTIKELEQLASKYCLKIVSQGPRHTYPTHLSDTRLKLK